MARRGESREKRKGRGKLFMGGALMLCLLGGAAWGLGTGLGGFGGSGVPAMAEPIGQAETPKQTHTASIGAQAAISPAPTATAAEPNGKLPLPEILVREADMFYGSENVDAAQLKERILADYDGEGAWSLRDDRAKKAAYDEAKAVLDALNMPYIER